METFLPAEAAALNCISEEEVDLRLKRDNSVGSWGGTGEWVAVTPSPVREDRPSGTVQARLGPGSEKRKHC